jgi:hypothetical protein
MMLTLMVNVTLAVGLLASTPQPQAWEPSYGKALKATRATASPLLVVLDKPNSDDARVEPELLDNGAANGRQSELLRPYQLCHVDVTTDYGQKVAKAFRARRFPHIAIIDRTGASVIFRRTGKIDHVQWEQALTQHKNGERVKAQTVSHTSNYQPSGSVIYSSPYSGSGSYCPSCQRRSF